MKSFTSITTLATLASFGKYTVADLSGVAINAFNSAGCSEGNYFTPFSLGSGYPSCTQNYLSDSSYTTTPGGSYNIYWGVPQPDPGCKVFIRAPADLSLIHISEPTRPY